MFGHKGMCEHHVYTDALNELERAIYWFSAPKLILCVTHGIFSMEV